MELKEATVRVIADDTNRAVAGYDEALIEEARLRLTIMEAIRTSTIPLSKSQLVLRSIAKSSSHMLDARGELIKTIAAMQAIKMESPIAPMALGCPGETPITGEAAHDAPTAEALADFADQGI